MKIDDFMRLGGENFRVEREGQEVSTAEGIRDKSTKEIRFRPDADVRAEDWLVAETDRRYYVLETDFEQGFDHETLALVVSYQTETQHATASDQTPPQPTQQFTFHAPAYGIFGSQQDF